MLSEKLYMLRKKSGLSQEQLAEQLNVSRQAISKWESGTSIPESDKLIAISQYFNVTLDHLMKEDSDGNLQPASTDGSHGLSQKMIAGIVLCVAGIIGLILWGLISIFHPTVSAQISESSMINIDGNGMLLIACVVAIIIGAVVLLNGRK
ncbi:helix-turn-helix transcriptional regulator [Anaerofilum hominis]